jgi:primosomal protein N' (replication factor Y)
MGLLALSHEPDYQSIAPRAHTVVHPEIIPQLNEDQQKAFDDLAPRLAGGGFSVNLLFGVTGSGKTEVYLRCIERVIQSGRRAIVLVPEIALTPQTVRRFTARFARVAVLHSGLGATQRHRYWQQILTGQADVVVGARSAIFAPLPDLGIIVVDEEHESSYKQDSAPRYHGRDLAIKRAQLQNVPIILGSATPSLETYCRVTEAQSQPQATSPYHLLQLPRRVRGLELPVAELVNMRAEARARRGVHLLSRRLEGLLRTTLQQKQQAILLLNRRGYANYIYCPSCQYVMQCKFCDATLTYHRLAEHRVGSAKIAQGVHTGQLHCHYCLAVVPLSPACPQCGKSLTLFGMGTQRVEEELARKFPDVRFARMDSDSMHYARDYEELLGRFADGQIQVLLGTQVIAKGLDYPNVTLVGVVSADTALALPDFRAAERTFQLITQVAGRCGRGQTPGRVVVQTFQPDSPAIRAGLTQDYPGFARLELSQRRQVGLPPLTRMVRIVMRDQDLQKLHDRAAKVAQALAPAVAAQGALVRMREPAPCAISRIAGHHRQQIVLFSPSGGALQRVLAEVRGSSGFTEGDRVAIDVDPVSLL